MKRPGIIAVTFALAIGLSTASWAQSAGGGAGGAGGGTAGAGTGAASGTGTSGGMGSSGTTGMNSNGGGMNNPMMKSSTPGSNPGLNGNHSGPGGINTNNQ
jgi:hypothetical protein